MTGLREFRELCASVDAAEATEVLRSRGLTPGQLGRLLAQRERITRQSVDLVVDLSDGYGRRTDMAVYVPRATGDTLGALVVLHGAGGHGAAMLPHFRSMGDALSMAVLCPTAQPLAEVQSNLDVAGIGGKQFNYARWNSAGTDFPLSALRWARLVLGVDPDRCALTGVSMGGLAAWNLGMRFWPTWAAGVPINGAVSVWERFGPDRQAGELLHNLLNLPLFVVHGANDTQIPPELDRRSVAALRKWGHPALSYAEVPAGGHSLTSLGTGQDSAWYRCVTTWLSDRMRRTVMDQLRHRASESAHGRAHWVELVDIERGTVAEVRASRTSRQKVEVNVRGARQVSIHLTREWATPGSLVDISLNGAQSHVLFEPDLHTMVRTFKELGDPRLASEQIVTLDVPNSPTAFAGSERTIDEGTAAC